MSGPKPHLVFLVSPGMGHLVPAVELSQKLTIRYGLQVTVLLVSSENTSPAVASVIETAKSTCKYLDFVHLPQPNLASIPADAPSYSKLCAIMRLSIPALKSALMSLKGPPAQVFMADQLGAEAFEVAEHLGLPKYMFALVSAWSLALDLSITILDKEVSGEYLDLKDPIVLTGCRPIEVGEFHDAMNQRTTDAYKSYLRLGVCSGMADGFLVNTWDGLQPSALAALRDGDLLRKINSKAHVYDVGPIVRRPNGSRDHELFHWLDKQPVRSVLFVSFGSAGTLSPEETNEVALGLEMSQERFIWVVRPSVITTIRDGTLLGAVENDPSSYLPDGFLERTKEVGLVIPHWAPQEEVLGHLSTGGFLTHCGWNSSLEAITNGVPVIAWPLYADQLMNARLLVEEFGVAVRPKLWPSVAVVGREEIMRMVTKIMADEDGSEIRKRAKELKDSAEKALKDGGSSFIALSRFVDDIRMKSPLF